MTRFGIFGAVCVLGLGLAGCGMLPGGAPADGAKVDADIELSSDRDEKLKPASEGRGFLGGLFARKEDAGLTQPKAVGDAVGEVMLVGGVVARAPAGYCVDSDAADSARRVAIIASCESVSGESQGASVPSAVMTVTVGRIRVLGGPKVDGQALAQAFRDQVPRAAKGDENLAVVQLEKGGDAAMPGASPVHWRGVLEVGPRLIGLAVYAPKGSPLVGARGGDLLRDLAGAVREASVIARRSEDGSGS